MTEPKPTAASKARAAAIHAEIDKLTKKTAPDQDSKKPDGEAPSSDREFIQQWMADHGKKPE
jgi:hypothetical protein